MPNPDKHIIVSFRLLRSLVEQLDARVKKETPIIKSRTQLVEIALAEYLASKPPQNQ